MAAAGAQRHPQYDPEKRREALAAYRRLRSYRKAAKELGIGVRRCHQLVQEGLKLEMASAQAKGRGRA